VPARGSGDDFFGVGFPDERLGLKVVVGEEAVDGGLEIDDALEDPSFEPPLGEDGEEALDGVQPTGGGGREVEGPPGMAAEPRDDLGVFVRAVIVEDDVDGLVGRDLALDGIEEADELLMAVSLHAAPDDLAFEDIEGGEQGGRAVTLIVMRHGPGAALLHRQAGLGTVERLDLGLFVDAEHQGVGGRIDIEADDVAHLGGELGIVGKLEHANPVRRQAVRFPDALHRGEADAGDLRHGAAGPLCRLAGWFAQSQGHDAIGHVVGQPGNPGRAGLVAQQAGDAFQHEAFLPAPDRGLADAGPRHDRRRAQTVGARQDDPGSPDVFLRAVAVVDDRLNALAVSRIEVDSDASTHPSDSHDAARQGIPNRTLPSASIH
jgi:hypothetical protein